MPLIIPPLNAAFIILSGNIFPYFKSITSACPSKPRSIERLKNDEYGLIYDRILTTAYTNFFIHNHFLPNVPLDPLENITFGFLFVGGSKENIGEERVNSFFHIILFVPFHI